jgi:hypothetical protein
MWLKLKRILCCGGGNAILLGLCAGLLAGCADLKSIRKFADSAADTASYTDLTADYIGGPDRMKQYQESEDRKAELAKESAAREKQEKALLGLHRGIQDYMNAIGALASDEVISYDASLQKLGNEIKATKMISDPETADAYQGIARILLKAATDGYRQKKLKQLIDEANAPFQKVAGALKELVGGAYLLSLTNEMEVLDLYYKDVVRQAQANDPGTEMVKDTWRTKREELEKREKACVTYAATIGKIAEAHQALFDNKDKLNVKVTLDMISSYSQDLDDLKKKIKQLRK